MFLVIYQQVQQNKQVVSSLKRKNSDSIEELRPQENASKINPRWSNDELLLAVQGVKKFGKDFQVGRQISNSTLLFSMHWYNIFVINIRRLPKSLVPKLKHKLGRSLSITVDGTI